MKLAAASLLALVSVFSPARRAARKGVQEYKTKKFPEARQDFREASRRDPLERAWNFNLGTADAAAGEAAEARAELARAAESTDPAISSKALYQLGTLDLQAKKYAEAANELRRSLELEPRDLDAKRNYEIAERNRKQPPPPPEKGGGKSPPKPDPGKSQKAPDDSDFQKKAGMTRQEADAMLRSLENEQKQKERASARETGKDW